MTTANSHQIVHVRVNNGATGNPTAVRIRFEDADGGYFPPLGHVAGPKREHLAGGNLWADVAYAYIDGTCEVRLPAGDLRVRISKGHEYERRYEPVERRNGQIALRFALTRRYDLAANGWYAGDVHAQHLTPAAAALEGAAEGLHLVNLLVRDERERRLPPDSYLADFSGQAPRAAHEHSQVYVNTYNHGGALGDLILLNCHRMVFPLRLDDKGFENYTLMDWCNQCHRKGGLVVCPGVLEEPTEHLAALVLGGIDALMCSQDHPLEDGGLKRWYLLLNCGFRVPLVGGSGKRDNLRPVGQVRTVARLPAGEPFSYQGWIEAVRSGRCYATWGPLIDFRVNGARPGDVVSRSALAGNVELTSDIRGNFLGDDLEVVCRGEVIWKKDLTGREKSPPPAPIRLSDHPSWVAARVKLNGKIIAHTSPVYVDQTAPVRPPVKALLEELRSAQVRCLGRKIAKTRRDSVRKIFEAAKVKLEESA